MSTTDEILVRLLNAVESQSKEIRSLRRKVDSLAKVVTPPLKGAFIYPDCGYEWMNVAIKLDPKTWAKIKAGQHVKIKGKGWTPEGGGANDPEDEFFHWDHWEFKGGIDKTMTVFMESPRDPEMSDYAYEGVLRSDSFEEFEMGCQYLSA